MTTYVGLLRGINVGRSTRIAMADLRRVVEDLGHGDVRTYVNSGNVVFTSDQTDVAALGARLEEAVAALGVSTRVLVRAAAELAEVVQRNPFTQEQDPKKVHAVFLPQEPTPAQVEAAAAAQEQAASKGSKDRVEIIGRVAYLHTPDGLGRSVLADLLARRGTKEGTARNWSTVTKLLAMCQDTPTS